MPLPCRPHLHLATLAAFMAGALITRASAADLSESFASEIQPLLKKHCFDCHDSDSQKGDLNLAQYGDIASVTNNPAVWQSVLERVQAYEMPPKKAGELNFGEFQSFVGWLRKLPKKPAIDCTQLASDRTANFYRGYVVSRRLNRDEYQNTIRDLFHAPMEVAHLLPADGGGGEGFDTSGNSLFLSPIHIERYLEAAETVVDLVLTNRPRRLSAELRKARQSILVARPSKNRPPRDAARDCLEAFASRAFRRPLDPGETDRFLTLFDRGWERGDGYLPSLGLALKGVLVSPHFLFLAEPEPGEPGIQPLAAHPLASKLSYFLWASMPDDGLRARADSGELLKPEVYKAEIRRMLADPKAEALGHRFALQWLDLERLGHEIKPDPERFPEYQPELGESMRREVIEYFNHVFREDRPLTELISSQYTFADAELARLYGLPEPSAPGFHRVTLSDPARGGLLGMAAVHTATSYPLRTSPVLRGRWVLESILGERVPPPPPGVPPLAEPKPGAATASVRQQLEVHRAQADCAACHDKMDPLGFGLENFDVLGRWRTTDHGQPIDARGTVPSGESFNGPAELKDFLLSRKDKVLRHLARKLTGYAFGRDLNPFDDCVIDRALEELRQSDYRASVLVEAIATSFPFRHRFHIKSDS